MNLGQMLRESAAANADRPVFIQGDYQHSYQELERRADSFAAGLAGQGVAPGDRVVLALGNSLQYLVAYYGVLRAGAVVVPHYTDARAEPLAHVLNHSGATAAVVEGRVLRLLDGLGAGVPALQLVVRCGRGPVLKDPGALRVVSAEQLEADGAVAAPGELVATGEDDLASIVYTSGTTGQPKGVMLSHGNLLANVRSIVDYLGLTASDRIAMVLPFFYVYGNSVLHTHVMAGGCIAQVGTMAFPGAVLEGIAKHRCTGLSGVPSTFERLRRFSGVGDHDLSSLRYVTQAGGPMGVELTRALRALLPAADIIIMYGQTEASARLSYLPPADLERKLGSAGIAIPGVELRVMDGDGEELPRGQVGEIVARGPNIMAGYWQDPEATARALRPEGLRTGDLARMDEEGFLFIQGRESEMIKSGAHRVGPQEIEAAVARHPGVQECAVVGVPDDLLGEAIAAFVVPAEGAEPLSTRALLATCHRHLPRFKMPAHVRVVSSLPRTPSGKVRKAALRERF